ncbi:hypothetical protein QT970_02890 [Microcoleus sp. herbarium8]|uniref:hypothetical protein n=1 Tax=Microcoleus sp. herbarium8 TaxID=3055436 RepID=UPI002FCF11BF
MLQVIRVRVVLVSTNFSLNLVTFLTTAHTFKTSSQVAACTIGWKEQLRAIAAKMKVSTTTDPKSKSWTLKSCLEDMLREREILAGLT